MQLDPDAIAPTRATVMFGDMAASSLMAPSPMAGSPSAANGGMRRRSSLFNSSMLRVVTRQDEEARQAAFDEISKPKNGRGAASKNVHDEVIFVPKAPKPQVVSARQTVDSDGIAASLDGGLFVVPRTAGPARDGESAIVAAAKVYGCEQQAPAPSGSAQAAAIAWFKPAIFHEMGHASHPQRERPVLAHVASPPLFLPLPEGPGPSNVSGLLLDATTGVLSAVVEDAPPDASQQHGNDATSGQKQPSASKHNPLHKRQPQSSAVSRSIISSGTPGKAGVLAPSANAILALDTLMHTDGDKAKLQQARGRGEPIFATVSLAVAGDALREALAATEGSSILTSQARRQLTLYGGLALAPDGQSYTFRRSLVTVLLRADPSAPSGLRGTVREVPTGGVAFPPGVAFHSACHTHDGRMIVFGGILDATFAASGDGSGGAAGSSAAAPSPAAGGGLSAAPSKSTSAMPPKQQQTTAAKFPAWRFCGRACCVTPADDSLPRASLLFKPSTFSDASVQQQHRKAASGSGAGGRGDPANPHDDPLHVEEIALARSKPLHLLCGNGTYVFNTSNHKWQQLRCVGDVPAGRLRHAAAISGEWMFVCGGVSAANKPCRDLFALHTTSGVWTSVASDAVPLSPVLTVVASPQHLLLFTGTAGVQALGMQELTIHISAKRRVAVQRIEATARAAARPDEVAACKPLVPLSRKDLDLQVARLTYEEALPDHLLDPRVLAVKQMQEKAYLAFGVACPLRIISLPGPTVYAAVERLHDPQRLERRENQRSLALAAFDRPPRIRAKLGGSKILLSTLVSDLYTQPIAAYAKRNALRVENALQLQDDQRVPARLASALISSSSDGGGGGDDVLKDAAERLYADIEHRAAKLQSLTAKAVAASNAAKLSSKHHAEDPASLYHRLYNNEESKAMRAALFEQLVVQKEAQWSVPRSKSPAA